MALKIFVFTNWFQFIGCCLSFSFPFFGRLMAKSTLMSDFSLKLPAAMQVGGRALVQYWRLLLPVIVGNWAALLVLNVTFQIFIETLAFTFLILNGAGV